VENKGTTRSNVDPKVLREGRDIQILLLQKKKKLLERRRGCVLGFFKNTCRS
jgi:hypothetical protein